MSSPSSSSEHSEFNFNQSPTGPLSLGYSSESDTSLDFTPFDYLTTSNNVLTDPPIHDDNEFFMCVSEEDIIPLPLDEDMLDESMSSDAVGSLPSNGSDEELDRDDPFWEFIGETKKPQKQEDDEEISDEQEEQKNEDDESAYDGDNDED